MPTPHDALPSTWRWYAGATRPTTEIGPDDRRQERSFAPHGPIRDRALLLSQDSDTVDLVVLDDLGKAGELYALFDEGDADMKRRSALKLAGVAGLDLLGSELSELVSAVDAQSATDVGLPELRANVTRLDRAYGKAAPHELLPKLR